MMMINVISSLLLTIIVFFCGFLFTSILAQHDPHFVNGKNTIVHLFEWKWCDIANECENFLNKKEFGGVQISPPSENVIVDGRPWWEKYQPVSYLLNNRNGDEKALENMIRRCNNVGIRIYADLVVNHMATSTGKGTAGNRCDPASKNYPAIPYSQENFHTSCEINFSDANSIRNCELVGLKDLDQSQEYVRSKIIDYMNHLINLGVAGFRVDAAKHMWPEHLAEIFKNVNNLSTEYFPNNSKPFIYQEIINTGSDPVCNRDYVKFGRVCEFKFGQELANCFRGNNPLKYLKNWGTEWGLINEENGLVFIDNHDTERAESSYLNYNDYKLYKSAIAFMLAHPYNGITKIMSSYEFFNSDQAPPAHGDEILSPDFNKQDGTCTNGWICQHRWSPIFNMVEFKSIVAETELNNWWVGVAEADEDNQIAFSRGDKGMIAISIKGNLNAEIETSLSDGTYCDIISGSFINGKCTGKIVKVNRGKAHIQIEESDQEAVVVIHVHAKL